MLKTDPRDKCLDKLGQPCDVLIDFNSHLAGRLQATAVKQLAAVPWGEKHTHTLVSEHDGHS